MSRLDSEPNLQPRNPPVCFDVSFHIRHVCICHLSVMKISGTTLTGGQRGATDVGGTTAQERGMRWFSCWNPYGWWFFPCIFICERAFFADLWLDTSMMSKSTSQPHRFTIVRGACRWRPASQRCPRTVCLTLTLRFGEGKVVQWFGSEFCARFTKNLEENMKNH